MKRLLRTSSLLTAILTLLSAAAAPGAVVIDSFVTPQEASIVIGDRNTADGPGIIGGERDFVTFLSLSADIDVDNQLRISGAGGGGDIFYDGNDNDPSSFPFNGMGSIDLTQGGVNDRLRFVFTATTFIPATVTIDVKNSGIGTALQVDLPATPGVLEVPFAEFPSPAVFQTVGGINLHFALHDAGSFTIDTIVATVPEPTTSSLMLLMASALGIRRRSNVQGFCRQHNDRRSRTHSLGCELLQNDVGHLHVR
jgi:hypothetical protein